MLEKAVQTLNRDDVKVNSLAPFMKQYHQREGDYIQRTKAYANKEVRYPFKLVSMTMTDEESYTCELCQMKFETIGAWRTHDGRNPHKWAKAARRKRESTVSENAINLRKRAKYSPWTCR